MALAHFQRTFTDAAGNIKPGLSVTVRRESDNGLAALFSDAGSVTPKSNPFNTDANGYGSFYVTDGRYRIQATDIDWRNEDLISQPSPNFTAMPQVGGDPIVESGSNTDGEWTRWADGTQIVKNSSLLCTFSSVHTLTNSWTYPASFNTRPVCVHTLIDSRDGVGNFTVNETTIDNISAMLRSISEFSAKVRISGNGQFSSGDTYYANVTATGRWK